MYRAYQLEEVDHFLSSESLERGKALQEKHAGFVGPALERALSPDGALNADALTRSWFPEVDAPVFISHSSRDIDLAHRLVSYLDRTFGVRAFVDSQVWGRSETLLRQIDDAHCRTNADHYSYEKRNRSTAHVHMILASALTQMLDRAECLFFLASPQSLAPSEVIRTPEQTLSPWIYHELVMSQLLEKRAPRRPLMEKLAKAISEEAQHRDSLQVEYGVPSLNVISATDLQDWEGQWRTHARRPSSALDLLYLKR